MMVNGVVPVLPAWLPLGVARDLATVAGAVLARGGGPDAAQAAAREKVTALLPALPATYHAEAARLVTPDCAPTPDFVPLELVPVDAGKLARRLALLNGGGRSNLPPGTLVGRLAVGLAAAGAARMGMLEIEPR